MVEGLLDLLGLPKKDAKFLTELDSKCSTLRHDPHVRPSLAWRDYNDVKVTKKQMERVLAIIEANESLVFMPIQGSFGFHPAFAVLGTLRVPGVQENEYLLRIDGRQLPEEYDFQTLTPYFASEENLKRAKFAGVEFRLDKGHYEY